jgi:hypothetical protein
MASAALQHRQCAGEPRDLVFIGYSHRDKVWLDRLLIFLKPFMRQNLKVWADPYIEVGGEWRRDIHSAFAQLRRSVAPERRFSSFRFHLR